MSTLISETTKRRIPEISLTTDDILNRLVCLYGKTKSGKTTIIKDLLHLVRDRIEICFVVNPSETNNQAFKKTVPKPMIHYSFSQEWLDMVFQWQEVHLAKYHMATDINSLESLYKRYPTKDMDTKIAFMRKQCESIRSQSRKRDDIQKQQEIEAYTYDLEVNLFRSYIIQNLSKYSKCTDLSDGEARVLKYRYVNPNIALIIDDCGAELSALKNNINFRALFYRSRHYRMTIFLSVQDDTDIVANLRKNVPIGIYTAPAVASANFTRAANNYDKEEQLISKDVIKTIFKPETHKHRKLLYLPEDDNGTRFYHYTAKIHSPFSISCKILDDLCSKVERKDNANVRSTNQFKSYL